MGVELNEKRIGHGFLGLSNEAPSELFAAKLATPRVMYTTDAALMTIGNGIKRCLAKKAKYAGYDLVLEVPLRCLPNERWALIMKSYVQRRAICLSARFTSLETKIRSRLASV